MVYLGLYDWYIGCCKGGHGIIRVDTQGQEQARIISNVRFNDMQR